MSRRTLSQGGRLYGAAHEDPYGYSEPKKNYYVDQYGNYQEGPRLGTKANPYTQYYGPGIDQIHGVSDYLETVWHPEKGYGVVLGKYKLSENQKNEIIDYDEQEIDIETDSQLYQDALELAKLSGQGYSDLNFSSLYPEMYDALTEEDIPIVEEFEFGELDQAALADDLTTDINEPLGVSDLAGSIPAPEEFDVHNEA